MARLQQLFEIRTYIMTSLAIVTFGAFVANLFGVIIPNVLGSFFKGFGEAVIVLAVFGFAMAWFLRARPHNRPKGYSVVVFDVYGAESAIDGIRTEFKNHDVAWSFMKQYKKAYPLHNFALVAETPKAQKRTIFRYI